jgi:uncharacterized protein (TIGR03790 family)
VNTGLEAATPGNVLVVANTRSALSRSVAEYYTRKRSIPQRNVCVIDTATDETATREQFAREIAAPIAHCLRSRKLVETILYIVTTAGVPLRVKGKQPGARDNASVDSELTLLYAEITGRRPPLGGPVPNPFFKQAAAFSHPRFPMYLVTRLAAYDFPAIRGMIDRSLAARNTGKFVIDLRDDGDPTGDEWLRDAVIRLPAGRVIFDDSKKVLTNQREVIGYASWGSNDRRRKTRKLGFEWLPGAIMTEFVSSNGRTFARPPEGWALGSWKDQRTWFGGSPQSLSADYIQEGATGASGHSDEPYLQYTPRPEYLLPAYYSGRNLAESFYLSIPALSWQNIVIGDPLCSLGRPQ